MQKQLLIVVLVAGAIGCATSKASPATSPATNGADDIYARAVQLVRDASAPLADPSFAAAERHALDLAALAKQASVSPRGSAHPEAARDLAWAADRTRDVLIACKFPVWRVLPPLETVVEAAPRSPELTNWFQAHDRELLHGAREGYVASKAELSAAVAFIDRTVAALDGRDDLLYLGPALRKHRTLIEQRLLPIAPHEPGLAALPTGRECHAALTARALGRGWDVEHLRDTAQQAFVDDGQCSDAPTAPRSVALGTLVGLALHVDGWSAEQAAEFARSRGCSPERASWYVSTASRDPMYFASEFVRLPEQRDGHGAREAIDSPDLELR